jgi:hypothetical protein
MPSLDDLWQWTGELKTSLPFAMALPIAVAIVFATLVDWLERRLATPPKAASQEPAQADGARVPHRDPSGASMRSPAVAMRQTADRF